MNSCHHLLQKPNLIVPIVVESEELQSEPSVSTTEPSSVAPQPPINENISFGEMLKHMIQLAKKLQMNQ